MRKRLKNSLVYTAARVGVLVGKLLPRPIGLFLFGILGRIVFLFPDRERHRTLQHLKLIYGGTWNHKRIHATASKVYSELGRNLFDAIKLPHLPPRDFDRFVQHDSFDAFRTAYERGKGAMVITAHVGCFEMLLHYFAHKGFRCFAIGRKMYDRRLEQIIRNARSGPNIEYMDRDESPRRIIRFLEQGKVFGVLIDQDTKVEGVFADFLGKPAHTPSGAMKLAMRLKIPVFVVTTARQKDGKHYVYISPELDLAETGDTQKDLVSNIQMANDLICRTISEYPAQWVWMHRRWRRAPRSEPRNGGLTGAKFIVLAVFLLMLFPGCGQKKESIPVSSGSISVPFQEFGKTTLYFYNEQHKRWRLDADYMRKALADTGSMLVIPVVLMLYDSAGATGTRVLADSGTTTASMQSFTVWGNVYVKTKDSLVIKTQKLWWNKDRRRVESDTYVQIETPKGDVLRGKGLDASEDFSRFTFKANVSGKFPDFKRRIETNDDRIF